MILQECLCNHEVIQVKHKEKAKKSKATKVEKTLHNVSQATKVWQVEISS